MLRQLVKYSEKDKLNVAQDQMKSTEADKSLKQVYNILESNTALFKKRETSTFGFSFGSAFDRPEGVPEYINENMLLGDQYSRSIQNYF